MQQIVHYKRFLFYIKKVMEYLGSRILSFYCHVVKSHITNIYFDSTDENSLLRNTFRDIEDLQVNCEGDLSPVHPEDLSGREFVIYQYGIYILQLLKSHFNVSVSVLYIPHFSIFMAFALCTPNRGKGRHLLQNYDDQIGNSMPSYSNHFLNVKQTLPLMLPKVQSLEDQRNR